MAEPDYSQLYAERGAAYRADQVVGWSYYNDPIDPSVGPVGQSRIWGDASHEVQRQSIDALIRAGMAAGLSDRDIGHLLAIARHESGFNPSAAAGTTSAHGLGQFINRTGAHYGIDDSNRWDVDIQAEALVSHFRDNQRIAGNRGQTDEAYVYKYHHDGPSDDYGGLGLARRHIVPHIDDNESFVRQWREHQRELGQEALLDESVRPIQPAQPFMTGALSPGELAQLQSIHDTLAPQLASAQLSDMQLQTLSLATLAHLRQHESMGDATALMISPDMQTIGVKHEHFQLSEFSIGDALAVPDAIHLASLQANGKAQSAASVQTAYAEPVVEAPVHAL